MVFVVDAAGDSFALIRLQPITIAIIPLHSEDQSVRVEGRDWHEPRQITQSVGMSRARLHISNPGPVCQPTFKLTSSRTTV